MARLRHAIVGGLLMCASFGTASVADVQVCVDDQNTCSALPGDQATSSDPTASDTETVGPPVSVDPFSVAPTPTPAPQVPLVISPGTGSDKQHLPPGPPNFQIDP